MANRPRRFFLYSFAAFCVFDLTRSGSYLVPVIFTLLLYLKQTTDIGFIRPITAVRLVFAPYSASL